LINRIALRTASARSETPARTRAWSRSIGALFIILALIALLALPVSAAPIKQEPLAAITSPTDGQQLRGNVAIIGSAILPDFERYELAYGPEPNPNDAWQAFGGNNQQVSNNTLGIWNTNVVADGTYTIRLRVIRTDSNYNEAFVRGVKVSNQQPLGTPTSIPPAPTFGPEATIAPQGTIIVEQPPTASPTPRNNVTNSQTTTGTPASNSNTTGGNSTTFNDLIGSACLTGLGWTAGAFILFGLITVSRGQLKHYRRRQRRKLSDADTQSTPPAPAQ
jgi:hypothetical protein